ncbi:MAG: 50S ribosomal protein L10 [Candidatus Omnitrophica bacterium]|nr:50S ribosomal protein L10 [Candidatus Omnitrophota bacterium]
MKAKMEEKLGKFCKTCMMEEVQKRLKTNPNFIITNYKHLKVRDIETLKKSLHGSESSYFVVKNSLFKRVLEELGLNELHGAVDGEVGLSFLGEDVAGASKALAAFAKANTALKIKSGYIDGSFQTAENISFLATLPSREVLLATVVSSMKGPINGFVHVLAGLLKNFVFAINEIKKKRQEGGEK